MNVKREERNSVIFQVTFQSLQPKAFGVKFSLREIREGFFTSNAILSFEKCLNYKISRFQRGDIYFFLILTILN